MIKLKIFLKQIKLQLSTDLTYRSQIFFWLLSDILKPLFMGTIWVAVANGNDAFSPEYMLTYYLLVTVVLRFTTDWSSIFVTDAIINGSYSNDLTKPFNPTIKYLGINLGSHILRIAILIPFVFIAILIFGDQIVINLNIINILVFIISIIIGFLINFFLGNIFALITVWVKQIHGIRILYKNIISILSGEIIPYIAMPLAFTTVFAYLPFRYILDFPVTVLLNQEIEYRGLIISLLWLFSLMLIYRLFKQFALKKYNAEGI